MNKRGSGRSSRLERRGSSRVHTGFGEERGSGSRSNTVMYDGEERRPVGRTTNVRGNQMREVGD
jgi:hypothetical protein